MSRQQAREPDAALIRAASRRMAWQIAVACVVVVVVVAVLTFVVGPLLHPGNPADAAAGDDDDALLRDGLLGCRRDSAQATRRLTRGRTHASLVYPRWA